MSLSPRFAALTRTVSYTHLDLGKLEILTNTVDEEDWAENWKKDFKPIRLGNHMVVKPSWCDYAPQEGDHIIELDPGMAFGTGTHEDVYKRQRQRMVHYDHALALSIVEC